MMFSCSDVKVGFILLAVAVLCPSSEAARSTSCGQSFCERSKEYPVGPAFQRSMENDPRFAALKGNSVPKTSTVMSDDDPNLPPDDGQYQICKSKSDVIFPQEAQNTRGERKFIINFGPFVQGVAIERCMAESFRVPCSFVGTPPDYQSVCVQKEMDHRLTTISSDPATNSVSTSVDIFRFPSYCACKLVRGPRSAGLCAAAPPPPPPPPAGVYNLVDPYGQDDANNNPYSRSLKLTGTSKNRQLDTPTTRPQAELRSRTLELFDGPAANPVHGLSNSAASSSRRRWTNVFS